MSWPDVWFVAHKVRGRRLDRILQPHARWQLEDEAGRVVGEARETPTTGWRRWIKCTRMRPMTHLRLEITDVQEQVRWWLERPAGWMTQRWIIGGGSLALAQMRFALRQLLIELGTGLGVQAWGACTFRRDVWGREAHGQLQDAKGQVLATLRWWRERWYQSVERWELHVQPHAMDDRRIPILGMSCALILGCVWTER
ncbi:MAG: hypothetical protein N3A53_03795 [Verrucomicrobiae bacterium]|nr:hypothetical protein [Verrucomicrobiae bacterium]